MHNILISTLHTILAAAPSDANPESNAIVELLNHKYYGNEPWRFGLLLGVIILTLIAGRIVRYIIERIATRVGQKESDTPLKLLLACLSRPAAVAVIAAGLYFARFTLKFDLQGGQAGFTKETFILWQQVAQAIGALAGAYFIYRLVDIIEYYMARWAAGTETGLDDMIVPVIRKSLRVFIVALSALFIVDNILGYKIGTILAAAGVGGLAIALAAQETLANFFGSINILADRPFHVGERIRISGFDGPVESVGFRSTRIRTLDGHLVSVPNSKIANDMVENIGRRPFIKRVANIGVTYDTPAEKVERAVQIIKDVLANTEEVNRDPELIPRVYFSEFKDFYLDILVIYWVTPPDYWLFQQVNEKINLAIMRAFEKEAIDFAFPTQTLYLKRHDE